MVTISLRFHVSGFRSLRIADWEFRIESAPRIQIRPEIESSVTVEVLVNSKSCWFSHWEGLLMVKSALGLGCIVTVFVAVSGQLSVELAMSWTS